MGGALFISKHCPNLRPHTPMPSGPTNITPLTFSMLFHPCALQLRFRGNPHNKSIIFVLLLYVQMFINTPIFSIILQIHKNRKASGDYATSCIYTIFFVNISTNFEVSTCELNLISRVCYRSNSCYILN